MLINKEFKDQSFYALGQVFSKWEAVDPKIPRAWGSFISVPEESTPFISDKYWSELKGTYIPEIGGVLEDFNTQSSHYYGPNVGKDRKLQLLQVDGYAKPLLAEKLTRIQSDQMGDDGKTLHFLLMSPCDDTFNSSCENLGLDFTVLKEWDIPESRSYWPWGSLSYRKSLTSNYLIDDSSNKVYDKLWILRCNTRVSNPSSTPIYQWLWSAGETTVLNGRTLTVWHKGEISDFPQCDVEEFIPYTDMSTEENYIYYYHWNYTEAKRRVNLVKGKFRPCERERDLYYTGEDNNNYPLSDAKIKPPQNWLLTDYISTLPTTLYIANVRNTRPVYTQDGKRYLEDVSSAGWTPTIYSVGGYTYDGYNYWGEKPDENGGYWGESGPYYGWFTDEDWESKIKPKIMSMEFVTTQEGRYTSHVMRIYKVKFKSEVLINPEVGDTSSELNLFLTYGGTIISLKAESNPYETKVIEVKEGNLLAASKMPFGGSQQVIKTTNFVTEFILYTCSWEDGYHVASNVLVGKQDETDGVWLLQSSGNWYYTESHPELTNMQEILRVPATGIVVTDSELVKTYSNSNSKIQGLIEAKGE